LPLAARPSLASAGKAGTAFPHTAFLDYA